MAEIVAQFIQASDPKRERCWIAEREGAVVGSVFLVRHLDLRCVSPMSHSRVVKQIG